jgi:hypothetical protein
MKTAEDLVLHFLKDMYYAERGVLKLFPPRGLLPQRWAVCLAG